MNTVIKSEVLNLIYGIISISLILLLSSASEIVQIVPNKYLDVDPDLNETKEKEVVAEGEHEHKPKLKKRKFYEINIKLVTLKIFIPGSITFISNEIVQNIITFRFDDCYFGCLVISTRDIISRLCYKFRC